MPPDPEPTAGASLRERVARVLADDVRPGLQANGSDLELVDVVAGVVIVRWRGTCPSCPSASMMLWIGIERALRERIAEVEYVEVTA
jgi:Fe-S cluster biogenesis protein NfuA